MSEENQSPISGHEYDGIQEYDNPLPMWWLASFFVTIIFGFHYWIHYEIVGSPGAMAELEEDMGKIHELRKQNPVNADSEDELKKLAGMAGAADRGKNIFASKCAACHGPELQGLIGPNLTDNYWIHGKGSLADIAKVIRVGVAEKGMPSWEGQLDTNDIRALAVFVASRQGSQPPNAKAPQGDKVAN